MTVLHQFFIFEACMAVILGIAIHISFKGIK